MAPPPPQAHFLIVTYPSQGHVTPARHLARRLVHAGARATVCVPFSAFRKLFPNSAADDGGEVVVDDGGGGVAYAAYSDGYDGGFDRAADDHTNYMAQVRSEGSRTVAAVLRRLAGGGRPVTCAVYTLLLPWVADVARRHGVAHAAVFWIQPTTALAAYFHYFRGHRHAVLAAAAGDGEVRLPLLPPLQVRDLPSFLAITSDDDPFAFVLPEFESLIDILDPKSGETRTYVLANTFDAMERDAIASLAPHIDVVAVGPVLSFLHDGDDEISSSHPNDLFDHDDGGDYLAWLDTKPARSVIYISFGSSSVMSKQQVAEIAAAMANTNKPFLWVIRKDNCDNEDVAAAIKKLITAAAMAVDGGGEGGMVVTWCDQARVLAHRSVGCFVTHCGWNSTVEAVACGVPVVAAPQYSDQGTNAWLVERMGVGVRAALGDGGGVVEAAELTRCVEAVMESEAVAASAAAWKAEARAAVAAGGKSERNLDEFVRRFMPK
uniref:Glycosyltransferase n=1 Tax=Leersia perrieri TaxID=77586 RepID=A0A0D9WDF8_9ORYZ